MVADCKNDQGWKTLQVVAVDGQQARYYLAPDKNKKTIRTEVASKKMVALLSEAVPGNKFHIFVVARDSTLSIPPGGNVRFMNR